MTSPRWRSAPTAALLSLLLFTGCSAANRIMDRAGQTAEQSVDTQVRTRTYRAIDSAFNVGENAVLCAFNNNSCIEDAGRRGKDVVLRDEDGNYVDREGRRVESGSDAAVIRRRS